VGHRLPRRPRLLYVITLCVALSVAAPAVAGRSLPGDATRRVSVDFAGGDPNAGSYQPTITADGRFVAFRSAATDIVSDDLNGVQDIFVVDVRDGTLVRATKDTSGQDPNAGSFSASISADGRFVVFHSFASDLVFGDGNNHLDVFTRDLAASATVRVSVDTAGQDANGESFAPSVSADGRFVAFHSAASDLVPDDRNGLRDIFVRDVQAHTTVQASQDVSGGDPNGTSLFPSISADGRFVAFQSSASDLIATDSNGQTDVFIRDLIAGKTVRASLDSAGGDPDGGSFTPAIQAGGNLVAFVSAASDLVPGDGNRIRDLFVRDLLAGSTVRVSVDMSGGDPNGESGYPSFSFDGRFLVFHSYASDLVSNDGNHLLDVFLRDLTAGTTIRGSVDRFGGDPNGESGYPSSPDGRTLFFSSYASDLIPTDGNAKADIFMRRSSG
jgi:Tol biopolymer transport system component